MGKSQRIAGGSYLVLGICLLWYWLGLVELQWPVLYRGDGIGLTFNSMMDHMLHGRFDVDPATVQREGFLRDGRVYAYWGVFPALLRLPLMPFHDGLHWDVTRLSCWLAVTGMLLINLRTLRYIRDEWRGDHVWLGRALALAFLFSGAQICFLEGNLYQEVCLWAGVFGMMFVHWAVRMSLNPAERVRALPWMALAAGGALLTRVSMAVGLYGALLLILLLAFGRWAKDPGRHGDKRLLRASIIASALLLLFAAITAWINLGRWGNPLTFADYNLYLMNANFPDRLQRAAHYGLFNVRRIPLGLVYYFLPVWAITGWDGELLLHEPFTRLLDAAELPPSSFLLTDGVLLLLCAAFFRAMLRRRRTTNGWDRAAILAQVGGLSLAPLLMLMAISMNFRYRIEFYPVFIYCAFLGAVTIANDPQAAAARWRRWVVPTLVSSILFSHLVLVLYKLSEFGPASVLLKRGLIAYYRTRL